MHFDKGLPFTSKEIILRPGVVAYNYFSGKRARYYNFFYLAVILIGLIVFVKSFQIDTNPVSATGQAYLSSRSFISKYFKYITLSFIPLFTISSLIAYRKVKFNVAEHVVIAGVTLIYFLIFNLLSWVWHALPIQGNQSWFFISLFLLATVFIYYQTFSPKYENKKGLNFLKCNTNSCTFWGLCYALSLCARFQSWKSIKLVMYFMAFAR